MERLEEYHEAVKKRLASACLDRLPDGTCAPPEGHTCAMELNLPEIVKAVKMVHSRDMKDYAEQVHELVCEHCINEDEHGYCYYRDAVECCLNNFMLLVVEAIEEVDARHPVEAAAGGGRLH